MPASGLTPSRGSLIATVGRERHSLLTRPQSSQVSTDALLAALKSLAQAGDDKAAWMLRLLRQSLH